MIIYSKYVRIQKLLSQPI